MSSSSPLRYPGGKQIMAPVIAKFMTLNGMEGRTYCEAYAGGAGAAISLLFSGYAKRIALNDADPAIAAMWMSALSQTTEFVEKIHSVPLTIAEWHNQKSIYVRCDAADQLSLGFSAFYLNRVNRSGIIKNAGPIGGKNQNGKWGIGARFNREALAERVSRIARYRTRISITNLDALIFLEREDKRNNFFYLDPPYFVKGKELYLNHYKPDDHTLLAKYVQAEMYGKWLMSYDDVPTIRSLYSDRRQLAFELSYSVRKRHAGNEILIPSDDLKLPTDWKAALKPTNYIQSQTQPSNKAEAQALHV